jgi:hypothetical protein
MAVATRFEPFDVYSGFAIWLALVLTRFLLNCADATILGTALRWRKTLNQP